MFHLLSHKISFKTAFFFKFSKVFEIEGELQDSNAAKEDTAAPKDRSNSLTLSGDCIPMITELVNDGNVQFLDQVRTSLLSSVGTETSS